MLCANRLRFCDGPKVRHGGKLHLCQEAVGEDPELAVLLQGGAWGIELIDVIACTGAENLVRA